NNRDIKDVFGPLQECAHRKLIDQRRRTLGTLAGNSPIGAATVRERVLSSAFGTLSNVHDDRCANWLECSISKLQAHPPADEARFQHRAAPSGTVDRDRYWFGTENRVARDQRLVPALIEDGVGTILSLHLQDRPRRE